MAYQLASLALAVNNRLENFPRTTLKAVANKYQVDRHTIEKAMRLTFSQSFRERQRDLLVRRAYHQLLTQPNKSIKEISYSLGFSSQSAFSRLIHRSYGKSPLQLRRTLLLNSSESCSDDQRKSTALVHKITK